MCKLNNFGHNLLKHRPTDENQPHRSGAKRRIFKISWPALAALFAVLVATSIVAPRTSADRPLRGSDVMSVYYLDIGQGDATLIRTPSNRFILIDSGPVAGRRALLTAFRALKVKQLDLLIASHPHQDHIANMAVVLDTVPVKAVLDSGLVRALPAQERMLQRIRDKGIKFEAVSRGLVGQTRDLGDGISMQIMHPKSIVSGTISDINNNSVVVKITYRSVSFLFTGDIEVAGREKMYEDNPNLRSTIYKVSHHGSHNGTDDTFMNKVRPKEAVISSRFQFGHPHREALDALNRIGARIWRTDTQGTIVVTTNGTQHAVTARGTRRRRG